MPSTVAKFRVNGDEPTAKLLEDVIYKVLLASVPTRHVLLNAGQCPWYFFGCRCMSSDL